MTSHSLPIHFFFFKVRPVLRGQNKLKRFIAALVRKEGKSIDDLSIIFCSDVHLLKINQQYLKHDFYTDVITFDLSQQSRQITGEVYISVDRVRANANAFQTSLVEELHRVIFHGILHLCGYNDKTTRQKNSMTKKEGYYLDLYRKRFT